MKMISGKKIKTLAKISALVAIELAILYSRNVSCKKLRAKTSDPSIGQYLNRLIEFFDESELDHATDEFLTMIDFGVYPHEAFRIMTFSGE